MFRNDTRESPFDSIWNPISPFIIPGLLSLSSVIALRVHAAGATKRAGPRPPAPDAPRPPSPARSPAERWRDIQAPVLNAVLPVCHAFLLQFHFQLKIRRLAATPDEEVCTCRFIESRSSDDSAIFHFPDRRIAVPAIQGCAIEDLDTTRMVIEADWIRLRTRSAAAPTSGWTESVKTASARKPMSRMANSSR